MHMAMRVRNRGWFWGLPILPYGVGVPLSCQGVTDRYGLEETKDQLGAGQLGSSLRAFLT